jgi:hypothetical protein
MNAQKTPQNVVKDTGNRVSTTRIVGIVAVAYAASMIVQNAVFAVTGAPGYSDPLGVVLTYHAENQGALAVTSGLEAMNMILLLLFVTALHGLVQRRGGLVAIRGSSRSDAFGIIRPHHCHAHRGRARREWPVRANPRLRADVAAPCRSLRARAARARGDLHRHGFGHSRQRFDSAVAAAVRRGGRQLAHLGRSRKPRHRGWVATGVRRRSRHSYVARLARCHWPTSHSWIGLTSPYRWRSLKRKEGDYNWRCCRSRSSFIDYPLCMEMASY